MKLYLILCLALTGCMVVVQKPVKPLVSSYDGNVQNSGVITKTMDGFKVTSHFRDRYNSLIETYGHTKLQDGSPVFNPPLEKDKGLKANNDGTYEITAQAMSWMVQMSEMQRQGFKP